MKLDYYTLLCPCPITLSVGTIRKPTLFEIGEITFNKFNVFQMFMNLSIDDYYAMGLGSKAFWESKSDEDKKKLTMFDIIPHENFARNIYTELLNFYFIESVVYSDNHFVVLNTHDHKASSDKIILNNSNIKSILNKELFFEILDILCQLCCINNNIIEEKEPKFKTKKAELLYYRMLNAKKEQMKIKNAEEKRNLYIPNIISAVASKSHGMNIVNIWETTLFQLYDQFNKLKQDDIFYINSVNMAVWGDEKNQFDYSLWYKNNYDK